MPARGENVAEAAFRRLKQLVTARSTASAWKIAGFAGFCPVFRWKQLDSQRRVSEFGPVAFAVFCWINSGKSRIRPDFYSDFRESFLSK